MDWNPQAVLQLALLVLLVVPPEPLHSGSRVVDIAGNRLPVDAACEDFLGWDRRVCAGCKDRTRPRSSCTAAMSHATNARSSMIGCIWRSDSRRRRERSFLKACYPSLGLHLVQDASNPHSTKSCNVRLNPADSHRSSFESRENDQDLEGDWSTVFSSILAMPKFTSKRQPST